MLSKLLILCITLCAVVDGSNLITKTFIIPETFSMKAAPAPRANTGPLGNGASFSGSTREAPCPKNAAIVYWGDWELIDPENNDTVYEQGNSIFFHHIMLYDRGRLVTGSSDERSSFGPMFNDNSKYAWHTDSNTVVKGGMYLVNFVQRDLKFKVRYTIKYYEQGDFPVGMKPAELQAFFTSLSIPPLYVLSQTGTYTNEKKPLFRKPTRLLSSVGHGHIGGVKMSLVEGSKVICDSYFKYHDGNSSDTRGGSPGPRISHFKPAIIELPTGMECAPGHTISQYPALRYIQQCDFSDREYSKLPVVDKNTIQVATYDAKCRWAGAHCQTYNWVVKE